MEQVLSREVRAAGAAWTPGRDGRGQGGEVPGRSGEVSLGISRTLEIGWGQRTRTDCCRPGEKGRPLPGRGSTAHGQVSTVGSRACLESGASRTRCGSSGRIERRAGSCRVTPGFQPEQHEGGGAPAGDGEGRGEPASGPSRPRGRELEAPVEPLGARGTAVYLYHSS